MIQYDFPKGSEGETFKKDSSKKKMGKILFILLRTGAHKTLDPKKIGHPERLLDQHLKFQYTIYLPSRYSVRFTLPHFTLESILGF